MYLSLFYKILSRRHNCFTKTSLLKHVKITDIFMLQSSFDYVNWAIILILHMLQKNYGIISYTWSAHYNVTTIADAVERSLW